MKTFTAQVRVGDQLYGNGIGRSKKEAEQAAAETAYGELAAASASTACRDAAEHRPPSAPTRPPSVPELPEVETVRDGLARHVVGAHRSRSVERPAPAPGTPRPARPGRLRRPP